MSKKDTIAMIGQFYKEQLFHDQLWGWKNVALWHQGNAADKAGRRFKKFLHNFSADWKNFCTALQLFWKVFAQLCRHFEKFFAQLCSWFEKTPHCSCRAITIISNHSIVQLLWHFSKISYKAPLLSALGLIQFGKATNLKGALFLSKI